MSLFAAKKTGIPTADKHVDDVWPVGKKSAYFACAIAFLLGLADLIDRQIVAVLFPYLKQEYALSDAQLGSLVSIVNISISILVVPSAYFVDRWSRKKMLCIMGSVWSLSTLACAFAGSFSHLLIARFFCGAGEAGYNPAAQSLLGASFPKRLRTTAASFAQLGMSLGAPVGMILGAYIAMHWGWRHAFGVVAVPGLLLSLLALLLKDFKTRPADTEPAPGNTVESSASTPASISKVKKVPYMVILGRMLRTPTLLCIFFASACQYIFSGMSMSWLPTYFNRVAELPLTTAGLISALTMVAGPIAMLITAPIVDWIRGKRANAGPIWLTGSMLLMTLNIVYVFGFARPGSPEQVVMLILKALFAAGTSIVGMGMIIDLAEPQVRATAVSLLVMCQNIFGLALGPVLGGFISDIFDLQTSLLLSAVPLGMGTLLWAISIFTFNHDASKVKAVKVEFE